MLDMNFFFVRIWKDLEESQNGRATDLDHNGSKADGLKTGSKFPIAASYYVI